MQQLGGAVSALSHSHSRQDEFIFVLEGPPTLVHLEMGGCSAVALCAKRAAGDEVEYPNDDLQAILLATGAWTFTPKDGHSYA